MDPISAVVIGAGNRGMYAYGSYALSHPNELQIMAAAEPDALRMGRFSVLHDLPPEAQFAGWDALLARPRMAHAAIICTQDADHVQPTLAALRAGYDVLLEKPMATSPADCKLLVNEAERLGRILQICHVLRFTPFFTKLHEIVNSGRLGKIVTVEHRENVCWYHMAHSFVRGNWSNSTQSNAMILAKCCHDLDILVWVMKQSVARLSSMGSLMHYRPEAAPPGTTARCLDGCAVAENCIWYAPRLYDAQVPGAPRSKLEPFRSSPFMLTALQGGDTAQSRHDTLKTSPYGRCVYHCDNDVVDHQVIAMEFEGGATCSFTMHGHGYREGRTMRWDGTRATLYGDFAHLDEDQFFELHEHGTKHVERIPIGESEGGHGGGDHGVVRDFLASLAGKPSVHQSTARASLESHLLAFAAEDSRINGGKLIDMRAFAQ